MSRGSSKLERESQVRLSPEMRETARRKIKNTNSPRIQMKRMSRAEFKKASRIDVLKKQESNNSRTYKNSQTLNPRRTMHSL